MQLVHDGIDAGRSLSLMGDFAGIVRERLLTLGFYTNAFSSYRRGS
jgi:hypothetical protein